MKSNPTEIAPERPLFWTRYRELFAASLSERDDKADLLRKFDDIFFETGWGDFRPAALRAALFIMLYRDEPLFRLPFALLNALIEIDEQLAHLPLSSSANGAAHDRHAGRDRRQQRRTIFARRREQKLRVQGTRRRHHLPDRTTESAYPPVTFAQGPAL